MATDLKVSNIPAEKSRVLASAVEGKAVTTKVYCTLCTRTVDAAVSVAINTIGKRRLAVTPGQKCRHCAASLDAAYVFANLS